VADLAVTYIVVGIAYMVTRSQKKNAKCENRVDRVLTSCQRVDEQKSHTANRRHTQRVRHTHTHTDRQREWERTVSAV